jgi:hypothetical protein
MAWKLFLVLDAIVLASVAVAAATFHGGTTRTVRTGVVLVDASLGHGTRTEGTGIVLTRHGEVLTNNHVIEGATSVKVHVPQTGKTYRAHILGYDVATDAALLQLDGAPSQRVAPSAPDGPRVGEAVIAVGGASGSIAFASGHVTGLRQTVSADDELGGSERLRGLIRFDAPIDPGDSGGPLLDLRGDVLGVERDPDREGARRRARDRGRPAVGDPARRPDGLPRHRAQPAGDERGRESRAGGARLAGGTGRDRGGGADHAGRREPRDGARADRAAAARQAPR